jgi:hypothetical protein
MSAVISIRIPQDIKKEMEELKTEINWNEEIKAFLRKKIEDRKKRAIIDDLVEKRLNRPQTPKGTVMKILREDRDSH